ncbi:hypothetical protein, partial [Streptomyces cellulosae]
AHLQSPPRTHRPERATTCQPRPQPHGSVQLGVAKILVADLAEAGLVDIRPAAETHEDETSAGRHAFAAVAREQLFKPLVERNWTYRLTSDELDIRVRTLNRISEGKHIPSLSTVEALVDMVGRVTGQPLTEEARAHLIAVYLSAVEETDPALHQRYLLKEEIRQMNAVNERLMRLNLASTNDTAGAPLHTDQ